MEKTFQRKWNSRYWLITFGHSLEVNITNDKQKELEQDFILYFSIQSFFFNYTN